MNIDQMQQFVDSELEGKIVLIRDHMAGVFVGHLTGMDVRQGVAVMSGARKIHYWEEAAAVEGIARRGIGKGSRVTPPAAIVTLRNLVQVLPVHPDALPSTMDAPEWKPSGE